VVVVQRRSVVGGCGKHRAALTPAGSRFVHATTIAIRRRDRGSRPSCVRLFFELRVRRIRTTERRAGQAPVDSSSGSPNGTLRALPRPSPLKVIPPRHRHRPGANGLIPKLLCSRISWRGRPLGFAIAGWLYEFPLTGARRIPASQVGVRLRQLFQETGRSRGQDRTAALGARRHSSLCSLPRIRALGRQCPVIPGRTSHRTSSNAALARGGEEIDFGSMRSSNPLIPNYWLGVHSLRLSGYSPFGETVAVKVRRPGISAAIAADLGVIDIVTKTLEILALFRGGFFENLRSELRTMLVRGA